MRAFVLHTREPKLIIKFSSKNDHYLIKIIFNKKSNLINSTSKPPSNFIY